MLRSYGGMPGNQHPYRDTWNPFTVQPFLSVRVHVLNATLEQAFSTWHTGFRSDFAAGYSTIFIVSFPDGRSLDQATIYLPSGLKTRFTASRYAYPCNVSGWR